MEKYVITTDSCADMPLEFMRDNNIPFASLSYTLNGVTYEDDLGETMSPRAIFSRLNAGEESSTTQLGIAQMEEFFTEFAEQGLNILHLSFSSGLSGSYNNTAIAARNLESRFSNVRITVVDSLAASMGQGLLLTHAINLRDGGAALEEVASWLEANKNKMCHFFTVNDLHHLYRGGRVSRGSAFLGTLIGIKPLLHVDDEGHLIPIGKIRGRSAAIDALANYAESHGEDLSSQIIYISHGDCAEEAEFLSALIKRRFNPKSVLLNNIGPVIGAHAGQGTIALFFLGKHK